MKDNWVIPVILRSLIARRFEDAFALTTNSLFGAKIAKELFPHDPVVIYSGASPTLMSKVECYKYHNFQIMLIGGLYSQTNLINFIEGIYRWLELLSPHERNTVVFTYAGTDLEAVRKATIKLKTRCELELNPYLDAKDYFQLCINSSVNCFLWTNSGFHHKLIELLYCRKPIISFPGLDEEEKMLARKTKAKLFHCANIEELKNCFQTLWLNRKDSKEFGDPKELARYTWEAQSEKFEKLLSRNIKGDFD